MLRIRSCTHEDAAEIQMINSAVMGYDFPVEDTEKKIRMLMSDPQNKILVAEMDGIVTGYIHLNDYDVLYFPKMKNILCLAVLPEYQRLGIASGLLEAAERWAIDSGAAGIRLDSGAERVPAHFCYEKAGYKNIKMHKYFRKVF